MSVDGVLFCMTRGNPSYLQPYNPEIDRTYHRLVRHNGNGIRENLDPKIVRLLFFLFYKFYFESFVICLAV